MTTHEDTPLDLIARADAEIRLHGSLAQLTQVDLLALARGQRNEIATRDGAHKAYRATAEKVEATLFSTIDDKDAEIAELEKDKVRLNKAWNSATRQALENGGAAHKLAADLAEARDVLQRVKKCQDEFGVYDPNLLADGIEIAGRLYALLPRGEGEPTTETRTIDIVFDDAAPPLGPRFVEVESPPGVGIAFGEWVVREDGYQALRFDCTFRAPVVADSEQGGE